MEEELQPFTADLFGTYSEYAIYIHEYILYKGPFPNKKDTIAIIRDEITRWVTHILEPYEIIRRRDRTRRFIFFKSVKTISIYDLIKPTPIKHSFKPSITTDLLGTNKVIGSITNLRPTDDEPMMIQLHLVSVMNGVELNFVLSTDDTYDREDTVRSFMEAKKDSRLDTDR